MDRRLLLPWILMLVLANLADGALTWDGLPPSQQPPSVDLTNANPCSNSIYTFSVLNAEDSLQFSITSNPNPGQFNTPDDRLYCTEATLKTNGYSSYTLTVTITDGTTTLTDTFTVTITGLPTTTSQTITASTTQATAATTTQTSTASTTQATTASTTLTTTLSTTTTVNPACENLSWVGPPPSQRPPSVNFSLTQPDPCQYSIYTFSVCGVMDQLKISLTQNPVGNFMIKEDKLYCTYATLETNYKQSNYSNYTLSVNITDGIQPPLVDTFTLGINNLIIKGSGAGGLIVSMVTLIGCLLISKLE